jgi:anti-sigma regulatory factor (Ser/Thr protein kinase)
MLSFAIKESSQVGDCRRRAVEIAENAGFSAVDAGRVAIVATELATNLIKHAPGGEMLIGLYDEKGDTGFEILALDQGDGISNLEACLVDGYSSAGTAGNGLGAVFRQSHTVDIFSPRGLGTAVLARLERGRPPQAARGGVSNLGMLSVPMPGQEVCGDACCIEMVDNRCTILVADGLGHGPDAANAATQAIRVFQRHKGHRVATLLEYIHGGLRATRGAAVSIAQIDREAGKVVFAGVGNVAGVAVAAGSERRMISLPGTAGHNARKIQSYDYPFQHGLVILHSDGLGTSWSLARYPGLSEAHPALIGAVLYRDFSRKRDDCTIAVACEKAAP